MLLAEHHSGVIEGFGMVLASENIIMLHVIKRILYHA
jgi:hypothetical protein